ncbi:Nuclear transcription factor Y subunit C-1 [Platanthera guangdongensis]|uniref:Nuclear transcription factor Y subunit C-1 n=1 Tax=Platanthera guangdongensis TaxID=2320717 RepID=A0ABR2MIA3_9ASPA
MEQASDIKNHQLPLAPIKKIMKADEDVRMISAEAPILFAKACELFILELTIRSWLHSEENKRRTLQKNDNAAAFTRSDIFEFLVDILPREETVKDEAGSGHFVPAQVVEGGDGVTADGVPYY